MNTKMLATHTWEYSGISDSITMKDCINHWAIDRPLSCIINLCLTKIDIKDSMKLQEKLEGRKVQYLPFLPSKNMRKTTLKNAIFCPNEVIHFRLTKIERIDRYQMKIRFG